MTRQSVPGIGLLDEVDTADQLQPFPSPTRTPRLVLRSPGAGSEQLSGAWWPWTSNLTAQLHDVISALTPRTGPIERVAFDWDTVSVNQRRIDGIDGIRCTGPLLGQPTDVMFLFGTDGRCTMLVLIPSTTLPQRAFEDMRAVVDGGHKIP
ncbi:DUF5994 family protein [Aldersonia sp. NBC_00410]|uniref:DUF5994 family protein n=1 Tax=Aldersonia sp. NBC_00410 TaxID=2975954 RepID=UPI002258E767|nr:DUF5994 family protein [Aldersonia sp. NBC_00410]MCX5042176.1 DUF5994 family protein [Aldersonia sp. NBC_00410]